MKEKKQRKTKIEELEEKNKEYIDYLKRLQAEFDNYRKRIEKEKEEFVKISNHKLIERLLPILDNFEFALKNTENQNDFFNGVKLIYEEFKSILNKEGLKEIKSLNEKFNPMLHEVILQEESDKEEGTIIEELQKGYMLNSKVLRFAKVKISKNKEAAKEY